MRSIIWAIALVMLFAAPALAKGGFNAHYPDMDADSNGGVSKKEFKAYFKQNDHPGKAFRAADVDGDGNVTHQEWHDFKASRGYGHAPGQMEHKYEHKEKHEHGKHKGRY